MNRVILIGLAALSALVAGRAIVAAPEEPDLAKKVTFDHLAMPAGRLIPLLAQESGVRLLCSNVVAPDVLLLTCRDAPLKDVMDRLAHVAGAEWVEIEGGYRLTRSLALARAQDRADTLERIGKLQQRFQKYGITLDNPLTEAHLSGIIPDRDRLRKQVDEYESGDLPEAELKVQARRRRALEGPLQTLDAWNPNIRFFMRCLKHVGLQRLAAQAADTRVVYSTNPNARQVPLNRSVFEDLRVFQNELATWIRVHERVRKSDRKPRDRDESDEEQPEPESDAQFGVYSPFMASRPDFEDRAPGPPTRVHLSVERGTGSEVRDLEIALELFDSSSRSLLTIRFWAIGEGVRFLGEEDAEPAIPETGPPVECSEMTKLYGKAYDEAGVSNPGMLHPQLREFLRHPEVNELLRLLPSDGFRTAASHLKVNVAACLTDDFLDWLAPIARTVDEFLYIASMEEHDDLEITVRDGWMLARPEKLSQARMERIDRERLAEIIRLLPPAGKLTIDHKARIAHLAAPPIHSGWSSIAAILVMPHISTFELLEGVGDEFLGVWGSLSESQRRIARLGRPIAYASLTVEQRAAVERAIYGRHENLDPGEEANEPPAWLGDLAYEPTVCAPRGAPPGGYIRFKKSKQRTVKIIDPQAATPDERELHSFEPDKRLQLYFGPNIDEVPAEVNAIFARAHFEITWHDSLEIRLDIAPWFTVGREYNEPDEPASAKPRPLSQIPADLRERLEEALDRAKADAAFKLELSKNHP